MDPSLTNFEFFKKKPAEGAEQPAPTAKAPPSKGSNTEMRNRMLLASMAKKHESDSPSFPRNVVASVTVDSSGRIVAVDENCSTMFGWKGQELVGQHLKVLLREGSESQLASLLQIRKGSDAQTQLVSLRVVGRRMDGREFPASVTRLAWTPQAPVKTKTTSVNFRDCWTAVFREVASDGSVLVTSPAPMVPIDEPHLGAPSAARLEDVPQFQGSPAALRSANEELQRKLEAMAVDAWKKGEALVKVEKDLDELTRQMQTRDTELKMARTQLEQELEKRKRFEAQMHQLTAGKAQVDKQIAEQSRGQEEATKLYEQARDKLSQAKLAAERAEAARQQEAARAEGFKQALTNLQQNFDNLNARVAGDQHGASDARRRVEELESILRGTTAEAERANAELDKRMAERSRLEAEWQDQVRIAKAAVERAEAAYKQEVMRADRAERDLANLRHGYDEVNAKLTAELHASAENKRRVRELETTVRESAAEVERANAQLEKRSHERNRIGSEWQDQIENATAAAERAEAAHKQELTRAARLERDLANLRERYDEVEGKLAGEQRSASEARRRVKELETALRDSATELERAVAEREKQGRGPAASELRSQLSAAKLEAERAETALREKIAGLEQQVAKLREERDALQTKRAMEKDAATKAKRRAKQLEKQLRDGGGNPELPVRDGEVQADLAKVKAAAERTATESRQRIDDLERRLSQSAAELARTKTQAGQRADHTEQLTKELSRLREKEAAHTVELTTLERRVRDGVASLARVTAEVESERTERRRSEERFVTLSNQLQQLHAELRRHLDSEKKAA
jgi:PAS domain S-box-containing protein